MTVLPQEMFVLASFLMRTPFPAPHPRTPRGIDARHRQDRPGGNPRHGESTIVGLAGNLARNSDAVSYGLLRTVRFAFRPRCPRRATNGTRLRPPQPRFPLPRRARRRARPPQRRACYRERPPRAYAGSAKHKSQSETNRRTWNICNRTERTDGPARARSDRA